MRGSGPPLLWLSGYVVGASSLDEIVEPFAERFTCITFDYRGSGASRPTWEPLTTARIARDAVDVLRELDVSSAHVYGLSLGGMVAQELAINSPERVRTLVLGGTTAGGIDAESPRSSTLVNELRRAHDHVPGNWTVGLRGALNQGWAAATHDAVDRLRRVQAPTLVVHGADDVLVPIGNAQALARLIPGAELRILEGAGHLFPFESEGVGQLVLNWFEAHRDAEAGQPLSAARQARDLSELPWRHAHAQLLPTRRSCRLILQRLRNSGGQAPVRAR